MSSFSSQHWRACDYERHARFVADLAAPLLEALAAQPGECILDLGCGNGTLSECIAARGATVIGADTSSDLVSAALKLGVDARRLDAHSLPFHNQFDAVFSNAALHWMKQDPDAVLNNVYRALKPGGRFVAELGGRGNVRSVRRELHAALRRRKIDPAGADPWYFPTLEVYQERLENAGFDVAAIELFKRPTVLPGDLRGWLLTFAQPFLRAAPATQRDAIINEVREALKPELQDAEGHWTVDYVRLRFRAQKSSQAYVVRRSVA